MEESEKRRERLNAMRMEAAKADNSVDSESPGMVSHSLSNPLIESQPAPSTAVQYSRSRFDYYTDPMSAFSAGKRRTNFSHQVSQGYSSMPPNMTSSAGQRPTQSPGAHYSPRLSLGSPMGAAGPLDQPQGNTSNIWGGSYSSLNYNYSPNMPDVNFPRSGVGQGAHYSPRLPLGSPMGAAGLLDKPQGNTSNTWGGSYSSLNYNYSPNMQDVNFPKSGVGQGDSPYAIHGWGRGHSHDDSRHGSSPYSNSGRGRGRSMRGNLNAGLGPRVGRGKDHQNPVSAELRPDLYYKKEMLEDPWKGMTPVIWECPKPDRSWLPKSISVKKARPSPEASHKSISQPNLAEFLATSLNDAVNEPDAEEHKQSEVNES